MQVTGKVVRSENRIHAKRRKVVKCSALSVVALSILVMVGFPTRLLVRLPPHNQIDVEPR